jgi:hypothetical protein
VNSIDIDSGGEESLRRDKSFGLMNGRSRFKELRYFTPAQRGLMGVLKRQIPCHGRNNLHRLKQARLMAALNRKPGILKEKMRAGQLKTQIDPGPTFRCKGKLRLPPQRCDATREIRSLHRTRRGDRLR